MASFEVIEPTKLTADQKQTLIDRYKEQVNGTYRGNTVYIDGLVSPRFNYAYLRITPPKFSLKGIKKKSDKNCLYIIPGGAVFYSESELNYHNNKDLPILKIEVSKDYSIKFLCAFLKSSFFLWYVKNKYGDFNFYLPEIYNFIDVPLLHPGNLTERGLVSKIETNVDKIIELEKDFLKTKWEAIKDKVNYIDQHNEETKNYFNEIDESIYKLLKIKEEDVLVIKENLRANNIFVPE